MKNMVETIAGPNLAMRAIFAICAFVLSLVLLPVGTAHAASYSIPSNAQDSGTCGGCTWYVTSASASTNPGQLVIYPTNGTSGTLTNIKEDSSPWIYSTAIQSIYVADGVKTNTTFTYAFRDCTSLVTADVSNLNTAAATSLAGVFHGCTSLESVEGLGEWNVSKATSLNGFFAECNALKAVDLSEWNCAAVTTIVEIFERCYSLESVVLPEMPKLQDANSAFHDCESLPSLDVSGLVNPNLSTVYYIFSGCYELSELTGYEDMVTSKVTNLSMVFANCRSLTSLDVSAWDTSNVTNFTSLFGSTRSLKTLKGADKLNTAKATNLSYVFSNTWELESLELGPNFKTSAAKDMSYMFSNARCLQKLDISTFDTSAATDMAGFFNNMYNLRQVTLGSKFSFTGNGSTSCVLPTPNPTYIDGATGNWQAVGTGTVSAPAGKVYAPADVPSKVAETYVMEAPKVPVLAEWNTWYKGTADKTTLVTVNIVDSYAPTGSEAESWDASAAQDGSVMAYVSADGKTLTLAGNGSGYIMANEFSMGVFQDFQSVTAFNGLDVLDMSEAKTLQAFFSSCRSIKSLDLSMWDTSSLGAFDGTEGYPDTDMYATFGGCYALESLNVSGWDVDDVECMAFLFSDCNSLKTIDLSTWDPRTLERADWLFSACQSLESVKGITGWGADGKITRVDHLFYNCWALESVDLSGWNVSNCVDMNRMFYYDYVLESVCFDGWDTSSCEDFSMMVYECPVINNLDVSGFDTSGADEYGLRYFAYNCFGLDNIILGPDFGTAEQAAQGWIFYVNTAREDVADRFPSGYLPTTVTGANASMAFGAYDWAADNRAENKAAPVLAEERTWYKSSADKISYTTINFVDSYAPTGSEKESWDASEAQDGSVMAYVSADGKTLTIAGNGSGYIKANADSKFAFDEFCSVTAINGLALLDTSGALDMTAFFADNMSLTSLEGIEGWDVSNCTTFAVMFNDCTSLTSLDLSKWDMSSAETIDGLCQDCISLVDLKTPTILAENLTMVINAFESCEKLESVDVSFMCNGKLIYIDCLFQGCESLKTIVGYETLVTAATENMRAVFNLCGDLEYLDLSKWVTDNANSLGLLFGHTYSLSTIDGLENWNTGNVESMDSTFTSCWVTDLSGISGWDVSNVETFDEMFSSATKLTSLDLSSWSTDAAEDMGGMFNFCANLTTLKLGPGFTTGDVTDFNKFLYDCWKLKTVDLSMINTGSAADMTDFFTGMKVLQQVTLGEEFSFTGDGSTSCVLPTPDPYYITGAIGKWQAVGAGTVERPAGTVYLPADVPSNVAETYVMPLTTISVDVPVKVTLAASADGTWCTPSAVNNKIVNHSLAPVKVVSAESNAADGFTILAAANVKSSTAANVFGGTIKAGTGAAQDLTAISTSGDAWTMAAETASDDSDLISLQLAGSIGNVEGKYFADGCKLFDITYTFELAL